MRFELFGIEPETGQWRWSKSRTYEAKAAYELYEAEHSKRLTLDEYWDELVEQTGENPNFVRLGQGNTVQYYVGPRNYKLLSDVWMDIRTLGKISDFPHEKHEALLERIISWVTNPGDLVLDSFAGSGTTGAVAQKMGRRWIMVEIGDHADTHIVPRLNKVIDGEDQGGISKAVNWQGGGGYRYYTLAPSLMERDRWGNWVIAPAYDATMLARAMCAHLGFDYAPSGDEAEWWRHGRSSETDFLYVTTQSLTKDALRLLSDEVGEGRSLMICAPAFSAGFDDFDNLTCRKIPAAILAKCEWGKDDYSLNVNDPVGQTDDAADGEAQGA